MAAILDPTPDSLAKVARHLADGGIAALPTETVYGLAADATNPSAVARIFAAKRRPSTNPLIVHLADPEDVLRWTTPVDDLWQRLAEAFWPGPLTLVLPKRGGIPDSVTAGLPTLAVRVPDSPLTRQIIRLAGCPVAAPSANPSGYISPTLAAHVAESLGSEVPYIIDGGPCRRGIESTIVDLARPGNVEILRRGPISAQAIAEALGRGNIADRRIRASEDEAQRAPGLFSAHYQPGTPLFLWEQEPPTPAPAHLPLALLHFRRPVGAGESGSGQHWLSDSGDPEEAARNLYHMLRQLDQGQYRAIYAQTAPECPLGLSINDRLLRAAHGLAGEGPPAAESTPH